MIPLPLLIAAGVSIYVFGTLVVSRYLVRNIATSDPMDLYPVGLFTLAWPLILCMLPIIGVFVGIGAVVTRMWERD